VNVFVFIFVSPFEVCHLPISMWSRVANYSTSPDKSWRGIVNEWPVRDACRGFSNGTPTVMEGID
jgi:hypothetical protein